MSWDIQVSLANPLTEMGLKQHGMNIEEYQMMPSGMSEKVDTKNALYNVN